MDLERVVCFVDGFNLYHAIDDLHKNYLKWVDLHGLASAFVRSSKEELTKVYYFSAFATWLPGPCSRHRKYVAALRARGVTPVMARFKGKPRKCPACKHRWIGHEEKETDVQIALHMLRGIYDREFDRVLLVSADTDLVPAVKMTRSIAPQIPIHLLVPPLRLERAQDLKRVCSTMSRIKERHLVNNLLPEKIMLKRKTITRPPEYDPPAGPST